ncbi:MAG: hypothetical protein WA364_00045 [Candidatus Nitrosopolaris sp.]
MEHNNELEVLKSVVIELLKESTLSKERTDELINKIMASTHTKVVEEVKEEVKKEEVKEEVKKEEVKAEPPKVETFVPKGTMPKGWKPAA